MTYQIYNYLREGKMSGDEIGRELNISRAAVNKHIKKLRSLGVNIESKSGYGYLWKGEDKINKYSLQYELKKLGLDINIVCQDTASTNTLAKEMSIKSDEDMLIVAKEQTAGRGRLKRSFCSKSGGAYFTVVFNDLKVPVAQAMRMVIATGLATADVLEMYGITARLKWPNDVKVNNKKICGILLELITSGEYADKVIIGIGININNELSEDIKDIATRMCDILNEQVDIARVIAHVVNRLYYYLKTLMTDWDSIKEKYYSRSLNIGRLVEYKGIKAVAKGITDEGFLIVKGNDKEQIIMCGDIDIC